MTSLSTKPLLLDSSPTSIARAAKALRAGQLVAFPTETVYGLGADATNGTAVAHIYEAKGRPSFNPLIAHCADMDMVNSLVDMNNVARELAEIFWPGPLTLVLPKKENCPVSDLVTAGLDTLAVRIPSGKIARRLLKETGKPIAAPSANASGKISPTMAEHVVDSLGDNVDIILNHGSCTVGLESTIVSFDGDDIVLLRPGGLTLEAIEVVTGRTPRLDHPSDANQSAPSSPGQLASHYAPQKAIRLNVIDPREDEAFLTFGQTQDEKARVSMNLSPEGKLDEAAANLFSMLHALDRGDAEGIAVMPIPNEGLGHAINDRLQRAAAPRPSGKET